MTTTILWRISRNGGSRGRERLPYTPKIVKTRKPYSENRCVIAVAGDLVLLERTGEVFTRAELPQVLATRTGEHHRMRERGSPAAWS
jgi:hypothetical protein